jgi:hypothetical protein
MRTTITGGSPIVLACALVLGCGGDSDDDGASAEGTGGTAAGGSSGATGGGSGGTGGGAGVSGASGSGGSGGGTGVLGPPGPGIACGETTCDEETEMCCVEASGRSCSTSMCTGVGARLECDDAVDCPGELCCFSNIFASVRLATFCAPDCGGSSELQVCKEAGECDNGDPCHAFACGGLDADDIALGLCTPTAPMFCE